MNVLIVEDEKSLAGEIALFLKRENFLCDMAHTGSDASEKIAVNLYDFVLLDLGLPDYNGLDSSGRQRRSILMCLLLSSPHGAQLKTG
jgi:DNA-binding response OmpR family regulator